MHGPEDLGYWSRLTAPNHFLSCRFMRAGHRYRVVREFNDYDGALHPVGEEWTFLGAAFLPYDDGWSWFVSFDGTHEWHIRLQDRPGEQGHVLASLAHYVQALT